MATLLITRRGEPDLAAQPPGCDRSKRSPGSRGFDPSPCSGKPVTPGRPSRLPGDELDLDQHRQAMPADPPVRVDQRRHEELDRERGRTVKRLVTRDASVDPGLADRAARGSKADPNLG